MKPPVIAPPVKLRSQQKRLVENAVADIAQRLGQEEFVYISERIAGKLEILSESSLHWVKNLWLVATAFSMAIDDHVEGRRELSNSVLQVMAVGLHYVINPFDIIPDHITGDGYIDDAHVLNECVRRLHRSDPRLLSNYLKAASRRTS